MQFVYSVLRTIQEKDSSTCVFYDYALSGTSKVFALVMANPLKNIGIHLLFHTISFSNMITDV